MRPLARHALYRDIFMDITTALTLLDERHGAGSWDGMWTDKQWMNTPGPLYCGQTDNCGTGPLAAPNNVHVDHEGYEFIFRQPVNLYELRQVLQAAYEDPWQGYGADGDAHWSFDGLKEWWACRRELEVEIDRRYREQLAFYGYDYGYYLGAYCSFSAIYNDVLHGRHAVLRAFGAKLNGYRLLPSLDVAQQLDHMRQRLIAEHASLEADEDFGPIVVYGYQG